MNGCRDTDKGTETDGRSAGSTPPFTDNNGAWGGGGCCTVVEFSKNYCAIGSNLTWGGPEVLSTAPVKILNRWVRSELFSLSLVD
jgi:hypothetical protein